MKPAIAARILSFESLINQSTAINLYTISP